MTFFGWDPDYNANEARRRRRYYRKNDASKYQSTYVYRPSIECFCKYLLTGSNTFYYDYFNGAVTNKSPIKKFLLDEKNTSKLSGYNENWQSMLVHAAILSIEGTHSSEEKTEESSDDKQVQLIAKWLSIKTGIKYTFSLFNGFKKKAPETPYDILRKLAPDHALLQSEPGEQKPNAKFKCF